MKENEKTKLELYSLMLKSFNRNVNKLKITKKYSQFIFYKRKVKRKFALDLSHFYEYPITHNQKRLEYLDHIRTTFDRAKTRKEYIECIKHFKWSLKRDFI